MLPACNVRLSDRLSCLYNVAGRRESGRFYLSRARRVESMPAQRPPVFLARRADTFQCLLMCRPDTEM
jgi:hypothetical protein